MHVPYKVTNLVLQCDLRRPACSQCTNASVVCAGYRNEQDLLFRDETAAVTAKLADHRPKSREESASTRSTSSPAQPVDWHTPDSSQAGQTGIVEDKAIDHLLNYYFRQSSFQYVTAMYGSTKPGSLFHQTVRATALAAYSHETDNPDLLDQARHIYGNALMQLGEKLTTLDAASDETLATVLLMSRFETLAKTADGHSMSETWSNHVVGAFELINTDRADGCLPNHYSLILVEQTVHNYNLYCLKALKRRPAPLLDLSEQLALCGGSPNQARTNHLRLKLHNFTDAFCPFSRSRKARGTDDSHELLQWARSLEEQCVGFMEELAVESKYEIIDTSTLSAPSSHGLITLNGTYHMYYDHYEARIWNGMRMIRLALNSSIHANAKNLRKLLEFPDSPQHAEFEDLMAKCEQNIERLAEEICASAPQFLLDKDHPDCSPAAGCFLAWPLYIAGKIGSERCGDYVRERLRWIGRELKIQAAFIAAEDLMTTGYHDEWLYACYMF